VLQRFAGALGLAFQIRDDLLDVEASSAQLGKTAGKDAAADKPTYVSMLGIAATRERLAAQAEHMQTALSMLPGESSALAALAALTVERQH
jgi:farnesyl diphosphate synthase